MSPEEIKNLAEVLKIFDEVIVSKPNEWLPVYAALGGVIASFFPTFLLECYREKKHSNRVLASLLAEIAAFLEVIDHRGYHDSIKQVIEDLKNQPAGTTYSFSVCVPDHYSRIYQENCGNIGALDTRYAQKIVIFHQLIDSAVQDVKLGGVISAGAEIDSFKEIETIFAKAIMVGNELLASQHIK